MAFTTEEMRIAAYLTGELPEAERQAVDAWRRSDSRNEQFFQEVSHIWNNSNLRLTDEDVDSDSEWNRLKANVNQGSARVIPMSTNRGLWLKIAASILLLFAVGIWLMRKDTPQEQTFSLSAQNAVETFFLPDSTQVWLNTNSSLSYTSTFNDHNRVVKLEGEAFFQVRRDQHKPFIVESNNTYTRVLGTSFNIRPQGETVTLTVAEGVVKFSPSDSTKQQGLVVTANEMAWISANQAPQKSNNKNAAFAAWREKNNPVFDNEKQNAPTFIKQTFAWRKNTINQSVITGSLKSTSTLATYKNIVLRINYVRANGKKVSTKIIVAGPVSPGQTIPFEKRLLDIFTNNRNTEVNVESADVLTN